MKPLKKVTIINGTCSSIETDLTISGSHHQGCQVDPKAITASSLNKVIIIKSCVYCNTDGCRSWANLNNEGFVLNASHLKTLDQKKFAFAISATSMSKKKMKMHVDNVPETMRILFE